MTGDEVETLKGVQEISAKVDKFTLRDYFAGQALAGIMSNISEDFGENPHETISKICYAYADALLKERKK